MTEKAPTIAIKQEYFPTSKTARYSTYGKLSEKTKYFWFVLHGSKMTCEQMLYKFSDFDPTLHFVVAPEGLNRFYANGFGGDVVASWMTKRDRLEEITDFSQYLGGLYQKYIDLIPENCSKIILGFSQGGTTMFRWLHAQKTEADFIIPYSCWIPEDIDLKKSMTDLSIPTQYTYGKEDQFLNDEIIKKVKAIIHKNNLNHININPYSGDHRISKKQLQYLFANYIQLK